MKINSSKFSKEQMLKITAALLVALSGILAGIVELFSNCCCDKSVSGSLCVIEIIFLVINILAVMVAMFADVVGILTYSKTQEVKEVKEIKVDVVCEKCPYQAELKNTDDEYYVADDDEKMPKERTTPTEQEVTQAEQDTDKDNKKDSNKVFFWSVISTAISFTLLCLSVVVLAII